MDPFRSLLGSCSPDDRGGLDNAYHLHFCPRGESGPQHCPEMVTGSPDGHLHCAQLCSGEWFQQFTLLRTWGSETKHHAKELDQYYIYIYNII